MPKNLEAAVENGLNSEARDAMQYAEYLAGMAFSNASLGYVHSMAHQLGGVYDLPHGLCNAILLPEVSRFNAKEKTSRFADIARAMGVDTTGLGDIEAAEAGILAIEALSRKVGTAQKLAELGVKEEKLEFMAVNALNDACSLTNPREASTQEIIEIFKKVM